LLEACRWLEASRIGTAIRDSQWGFALVEMVHLLALAVLGGSLLVTGLRVWGFLFQVQRPGAATRDLGWLLAGSFAAMLASGLLLFADGPLRYYANPAFRVKLLLIAGAVVTGLLTHLIGIRDTAVDGATKAPKAMKAMALLSCALWLGAGIAGRVIGVL
jgi:hypothetical protein